MNTDNKIKNNEFYEYDLHHENYYGTSKKLMNGTFPLIAAK